LPGDIIHNARFAHHNFPVITFRRRKASAAVALTAALTISLVPLSAFSAQKISAGASCKKLNSKATANNKTYTCIKKGTKLVWNSGVAIKEASSTATPKPTSTSLPNSNSTNTSIDALSRDPRISASSTMTQVSTCKTIDKTPDYSTEGSFARNGFPRPKEVIYPSNKAKVLVIPFQFESAPFITKLPLNSNRTSTDLDLLKNVNKDVEEFVRELSNGKFQVEISILPEKDWWNFDSSPNFSPAPLTDNFGPIKDLIRKNDGKVDFEQYDSYVFLSAFQSPTPSIAQAAYSTEVRTSKGKANKLVLMTTSWTNAALYFHELGHSMFGLEDLYIQVERTVDWLPEQLKVILPWDLMADSSQKFLTNWNRLLMGWLSDSEIRCLTDQSKTTHYLSYFTGQNQPKLLLINLEPGVTLAAETRMADANQGLLLYLIDTNLSHGEGPLRALTTLIKKGESKELFNWKFNVLETSKEGLLLEVSKGSGNKYVAPPPRSGPNNAGSGDYPKPRTGEVVPTTYLKARAKWEISNYRSYRIFVTTTDEPNKILFDTGVVNDSKDPLEVEISGLVCGKDFITTSQFWTERDKGGGFVEVPCTQLRRYSCQ
jgi:M6 family metalloprotease-like protein